MKISNKARQHYLNLLKDGYYLLPKKFENCTIVYLTKDIHSNDLKPTRKVMYKMNLLTANKFVKMFGFKMNKTVNYFGYESPISNNILIYFK